MARRGRKPKSQADKLKAALERNQPADYIIQRRKVWSFVQPPTDKRLDGRNGEIDSEICDPIGQLCALGLLDGHGHEAKDMRDKGRFWGQHYAKLMKPVGTKTGSYEPRSRSTGDTGALTKDDLLFDRIDSALPRYEREVLQSLIVDPLIGHHEDCPWAQSLIDEALLQRGRVVLHRVVVFPGAHERGLLEAAIRGLVVLVDGALPSRFEMRRVA